MRPAMSLPLPGISRSPRSSSLANSCGWFEAMSAALRYARILNGFSSLISSRSAISRRMRAIAALSKPESFRFDAVVQQTGAPAHERLRDRLAGSRRTVAEQTPAAAGAAHLCCRRARRERAIDEIVDRRRGDAWRKPLAVLPLDGDVPADRRPVLALEGRPQIERRVADAFEAIEHVAVAV